MAEETKKADTSASGKKTETANKPTGTEHWGEGGRFRIDANGKRVRKPVPKD